MNVEITDLESKVLERILESAQESFYSAPEAYANSEPEKEAFETVTAKLLMVLRSAR